MTMSAPAVDKLESALEKMNYAELVELSRRVGVLISTVKDRERDALRARMVQLAGEAGFTLDDLASGKRGPKKGAGKGRKFAPPKFYYRNPDDPGQKPWSGRGKRPNWLVKAQKKGHDLDKFRVPA